MTSRRWVTGSVANLATGHGAARTPSRGYSTLRRGAEGARVRVVRVRADVPVQYVHGHAVAVIGELPVRRLLGLRVGHGLQADQVIPRVAGRTVGRLLPPVGERVRLRLVRLVDEQEDVAVR